MGGEAAGRAGGRGVRRLPEKNGRSCRGVWKSGLVTGGDLVVKREQDNGLGQVLEPRRKTCHSLVQADTESVQ